MAPSQTFHDHIHELRKRFLWVVLAVGVSAAIAYTLRVRLISLLQEPLGVPLFYSSPAGSFNFVMRLSMVIGVFIALPVLIYQFLRFIEPALPQKITKMFMIKVIGASFLLALAGVAFAYFFMIPMSLRFFAGYSTPDIKPLISANEYLSYIMSNLIIFALVFQIPLLILFINRIKPLKPSQLLRYQRHVIIGALVFALILPFTYDPISQFIVAIPIVVLYYFSTFLLWLANRRGGKKQTKATPKFQPYTPPTAVQPVPIPALGSPIMRPATSLDGFVRRQPLYQPRSGPIITARPAERTVPSTATQPRLFIDGVSPVSMRRDIAI